MRASRSAPAGSSLHNLKLDGAAALPRDQQLEIAVLLPRHEFERRIHAMLDSMSVTGASTRWPVLAVGVWQVHIVTEKLS
jgi:hypothetical protein